MTSGATHVSDAVELQAAVARGVDHVVVEGDISGMPMLTLAAGQRLSGGTLRFGGCGVRLTRDNTLDGIAIVCPEHERAVLNDTSVADWGTLELRDVRTEGQVLLLAQDDVRAGHVVVDGLHVAAADVRGRELRPHGFGVDALQGAFTLWNRQAEGELTAELSRISAGSRERPVRGSGVFVGGAGDWQGRPHGGTVRVSRLTTGEIHCDGGIAPGTPDLISGGVFVIHGAVVADVLDEGAVTTYGQNDMVLDNWGAVERWTAKAPLTSHGPSGIGFVQFAELGTLNVEAPIETFGTGARGFNAYDGSLREAHFASITTHADAGVGIQISRAVGKLTIDGDVTTTGGTGDSLVKGRVVPLPAYAMSIQDGGELGELTVGGALVTEGEGVTTLQVQGTIHRISVGAGVAARGAHSQPVAIEGGTVDLTGVEVR